MQSKAAPFNKQAAAASGAPPLFPRPTVAQKAASHLTPAALDLPDYLARTEAAGHQRDWLHTAPPNALLIPHDASFGESSCGKAAPCRHTISQADLG